MNEILGYFSTMEKVYRSNNEFILRYVVLVLISCENQTFSWLQPSIQRERGKGNVWQLQKMNVLAFLFLGDKLIYEYFLFKNSYFGKWCQKTVKFRMILYFLCCLIFGWFLMQSSEIFERNGYPNTSPPAHDLFSYLLSFSVSVS